MSLRLHERVPADTEVRIKNLTQPDQSATGWILDVSESGMAVLLRLQLASGDMVQIDIADCELFGHVIYVREENGAYRTGIDVEQVLLGRSDLTRLVQALSRETPKVPEPAPAE
jgi:hypothetical protein